MTSSVIISQEETDERCSGTAREHFIQRVT
jgi:hypothetical protein